VYYADLSPYEYSTHHGPLPFVIAEVLNVGWLEAEYPHTQGEIHAEAIPKLGAMIASQKTRLAASKGFHECSFCDASASQIMVYDRNEYRLGNTQIWLPSTSKAGVIYAAPTLIYHYVVHHAYLPPLEFVHSVIHFDFDSDWDAQAAYKALVQKYRRSLLRDQFD
jgi:hypothetical protein